jgi:hypothetical protein
VLGHAKTFPIRHQKGLMVVQIALGIVLAVILLYGIFFAVGLLVALRKPIMYLAVVLTMVIAWAWVTSKRVDNERVQVAALLERQTIDREALRKEYWRAFLKNNYTNSFDAWLSERQSKSTP